MQIVEGEKSLPCIELKPVDAKSAASKLAIRILELLAKNPDGLHAYEIGKLLREHEQKIYYHVRKLRKAGALLIDHLEDTHGATAKVLRLKAPSFCIRFKEFERAAGKISHNREHIEFLDPFIQNGKWNARIVVGSPDPHGPESARSRDASYAIDLGMFFGTYLYFPAQPSVVLDTELRNWKQNLIIIGGPVVNKAADKVRKNSPIQYSTKNKAFKSQKKEYSQENAGIVVKMENPFAKGKYILLISGKRYTGTRAAILAFVEKFDELCTDNARVVEGLDTDSDGIIDDVRFLE